MNEQLIQLNDILQTRVKYVRSWGSVMVEQPTKNTFSIKWYSYQGDPDNTSRFQITTYPINMLGFIIKEQSRKLKKDIPKEEQEVLKSIL